jgi:hypothetical protein
MSAMAGSVVNDPDQIEGDVMGFYPQVNVRANGFVFG